MNGRIGPACLTPGLGFGGSCLGKDTAALAGLARSVGEREVEGFWRGVGVVNERWNGRVGERVLGALAAQGDLGAKKVAVLGWAYKTGTGDVRGSVGAFVAGWLMKEGVEVRAFDPVIAESEMKRELEQKGEKVRKMFVACQDVYEACEGVGAVLVMSDEKGFECIEWERIKKSMKGRYVFDGRGSLDTERLKGLGLVVDRIGKT